ncbi:MAG TPA: type 4a pilus biogenesis protein PilO [Balneolales bacterium]|nr:type 4a pilus biogenesis protein PilO [Balneolales bacterium]
MDSIEKNKWQLLAVACVLIGVIMMLEYIVPGIRSTARTIDKLHVQQQKIASVQNWENRLSGLQSRRNHLKKYFSKIYVSFPRDDQMSAIVSLIYKMGKKSGIDLEQMQPGRRKETKSFVQIPITLDMKGSFPKVGRFVNLIEQSKYLIRIQELQLTAGDKDMQDLKTSVLLQIIILKNSQDKHSGSDA